MTQPVVLCPQCASTVADGEEFCPVCGDFLGWRGDLVVADLVVVDEPARLPEADPLAQHRQARAVADERAAAAQADAARAQVRLERTRRRGASARRRLERLQSELPAAEQRVREAVAAAERAAAGARRAKSAADAAQREPGPRRDELRKRARDAGKAERSARAASLQAQEALSTLSGVLQGVRAEVAAAPAEASSAQRARDAARAEAAAALAEAVAAAAELTLQERLLQLRATPRRVVALAEHDERELREQVQQEADEAARDAERRAGAAEKRQRRRAERDDERRDQAEQQSDARELGEVLAGAGHAERAAAAAERAVESPEQQDAEPGTPAGATGATGAEGGDTTVIEVPHDTGQPGALQPSEVRRRVRRQAVQAVPPDDGPVPCPSCAVGNATARYLCRVCGTALLAPAPPPPPVRLSWWRRLLRLQPPGSREPVFVPAGARPVPGGNRRTAAAVRRAKVGDASALRDGPLAVAAVVVLALLVLGVALAVVLTPLGGALGDLASGGREQVRRVSLVETPLVPLSTQASSTGLTSAPALAVDGDPLTSWTPETAPGTGADLGVSFLEPADLVAVRVTSAAGTGRPRPASVTVLSAGNEPVVLRLRDSLQPQRFDLRLRGVSTVQVRLDDLYPGRGDGLAAGLAEVELLVLAPRAPGGGANP